MLLKAAGPGRIRGVALAIYASARAAPDRASPLLRDGLKDARQLHSRERRLVRDGLYGMIRGGGRLAFALQSDDPLALWLGWLVELGLPVDDARAVLDAPFEALAEVDARLEGLPLPDRLVHRHGLPPGVVARWIEAWGPTGAEALTAALDQRAPVTLRVNRRRAAPEALVEALAAEGIVATVSGWGLRVEGDARLTETAAFRDGAFEVQDEGSQRLVELVPEGARVVDLCAGAGGKSLALADRGQAVLAADVRGGALAELQRRARRAGVTIPTVRIAPRGALPEALVAFRPDAVLVDAPCSGSGVLRRHPEHRWALDEERIAGKAALQQAILARAADLVPAGGHLIYGTCSLLADENEAVVGAFLAARPDFGIASAPLRTAPHIDGSDGFFGQVLQRSGSLHSTRATKAR